MTNEIQKQEKPQISISGYSGSKALMPNNIEEAYRVAQAFSKSSFIPQVYRGKPDEAFAAICLGMEVGLPAMRSLQSIAVVNGTPCVYGDAQLALVKASNQLILFEESYQGIEDQDDFCAVCKLQRIGDADVTTEKFTVADAKRAKLWGKVGTWTTHPKRMLRYKARAFALRDKFADVLLGLTHSIEEMEGEDMININPNISKTAAAHTPPPQLLKDTGKKVKQEELFSSNESPFDLLKQSLMSAESSKELKSLEKEANDFKGFAPAQVMELRNIFNGRLESL